jgi:hypothetical protein
VLRVASKPRFPQFNLSANTIVLLLFSAGKADVGIDASHGRFPVGFQCHTSLLI